MQAETGRFGAIAGYLRAHPAATVPLLAVLFVTAIFYLMLSDILDDTQLVRESWNTYQQERSEKLLILNDLQADLGHGGMIHALSDLVLTGSPSRGIAAHEYLGGAEEAVRRYYRVGVDAEERAALQSIEATLAQYRMAIADAQAAWRSAAAATPDGDATTVPAQMVRQIARDAWVNHVPAYGALKRLADREVGIEAQPTHASREAVLVNRLHQAIGLGGLIHHMQLFIVEGTAADQARALQAIQTALGLIDTYRTLGPGHHEIEALDQIALGLQEHELAVAQIAEAHAAGQSLQDMHGIMAASGAGIRPAFDELDHQLLEHAQATANSVTQALASIQAVASGSAVIVVMLMAMLFVLLVWFMLQRERSERKARASARTAGRALSDLKTQQDALDQHVIIARADPHGVISYVNDKFCDISGYKLAEVTGKTHALVSSGHHPKAFFKDMWHAIKGGNIWQGEIKNRAKDGSFYWVQMTIAPITDDDGNISEYLSLSTDITESKRIEQRQLQSQKMDALGKLTGGVAHDFNNLLAIMMGCAEEIEDLVPRDGLEDFKLAELKSAIDRGSELTERLLVVSSQTPHKPTNTNFTDLLQGFHPELSHFLGSAIDLEMTVADDLWQARVDPKQAKYALSHLCQNAKEAMRGNGTIRLQAMNVSREEPTGLDGHGATTDYVSIKVEDSGKGMTSETRERIFEPFFTTKPFGYGSGLGLSMVYGFVKRSGGQIEIESDIGQGSSFTILLPRIEEHEPL